MHLAYFEIAFRLLAAQPLRQSFASAPDPQAAHVAIINELLCECKWSHKPWM